MVVSRLESACLWLAVGRPLVDLAVGGRVESCWRLEGRAQARWGDLMVFQVTVVGVSTRRSPLWRARGGV